ncbi:MAG TPA: hypothetical protein VE987_08100 [Polyangiaceae bacterium]|nr:hypothetical protein [Polyangiaceae bacterium]
MPLDEAPLLVPLLLAPLDPLLAPLDVEPPLDTPLLVDAPLLVPLDDVPLLPVPLLLLPLLVPLLPLLPLLVAPPLVEPLPPGPVLLLPPLSLGLLAQATTTGSATTAVRMQTSASERRMAKSPRVSVPGVSRSDIVCRARKRRSRTNGAGLTSSARLPRMARVAQGRRGVTTNAPMVARGIFRRLTKSAR